MLTSLKHTIGSLINPLLSNCVYEMKYGSIKFKRKGGLDFLKRFVQGTNPEAAFLTSLDLKGKTIYDIGGHIGLMTIVFAKATGPTGKVIVFEPNEGSYSKIIEHIRLNQVDNVKLLKLGIGDVKSKEQVLIVRQNSSATGSLDEKIQSQIIKEGNFKRLKIEVDTLDNVINTYSLPKPDFIKIDIEGMEYQALMGMSQTIYNYAPQFHIEIHGADELSKIENISRIVELFLSHGYSIWHIETQQNITLSNYSAAKSGHIFCKR